MPPCKVGTKQLIFSLSLLPSQLTRTPSLNSQMDSLQVEIGFWEHVEYARCGKGEYLRRRG